MGVPGTSFPSFPPKGERSALSSADSRAFRAAPSYARPANIGPSASCPYEPTIMRGGVSSSNRSAHGV
jgi:hypothetical protein